MAGPWEKYQAQAESPKPWEKYGGGGEAVSAERGGGASGSWDTPRRDVGFLEGAGMGALRGAKDVIDTGAQWLASGFDKLAGTREGDRVQQMNDAGKADFKREYGDSTAADVGRLAGQVAATWPVGGALGAGLRGVGGAVGAASRVEPLAQALASGGMRAGGVTGAAGLGVRALGGAATGGLTAGLVDPDSAGTGAIIGAALPVGVAGVGKVGNMIGSAMRGGGISPEVAQLAQRAQELGIDVPADRIANSKPLNAVAASLNYIPLSGRAATESRMQNQLNRAVSKTFGQDSDNVTMALRKAGDELGAKFDTVLKKNSVNVDNAFMDDLIQHAKRASEELAPDQASIISRQIDNIIGKVGQDGAIDGQTAYNIKKTLDRIGSRNDPTAWYANDLKRSLMGALDRSIGPEQAASFATTRKQYGTMMDLRKLAQNGAEGDISAARLANMKNIGNKDLQELADISAQFLKSREGQHGAMQRVALGGLGLGGAVGGIPLLPMAGGMAAGRAANGLLNSNAVRSLLIDGAPQIPGMGLLGSGTYHTAPLLSAQ